ncbi:MAG: outer membrane lipoprotein carrier protein LolA [Flavobacteriales bacterium]|nr:outer membrane lipoprotein carrier protein LolA [Flavobacteriales bacterium]MDG1765780.1 outer membrane lipoprotein carrier protein LolA [Flavobacteriales bacterium]
MKKISFLLLLMMAAVGTQAQDAAKILNELSAKAKKYQSIEAEYTSRMIDKINGVDISTQGSIKIKGEKYHLDLGDYTLISDGATLWTYQKESNECMIDDLADMEDEAFNPSDMFTLWEQDFKNEYKGEVNVDGVDCFLIHLYPTDTEERDFHTIKMYIDKNKMELFKMEVKGREGSDMVYKVKSFKTNTSLSDAVFKFNKALYPGVEMIDNRF